MKKRSLGIMLTERCNANCRMCGLSCSPKLMGVIEESLMIEAINQAKELGTFMQIGFTGGEAFLYPDLLIKGSNYAQKLGFKTSVASNGFWGSWAEEKIDAVLSKVALDAIFFSFDAFHNEYISQETFERALNACRRNKIKCEVGIGEARGKYSANKILKSLGKFKYFMEYSVYPFYRVGRAENLPKEIFYPLREMKKKCYDDGAVAIRYDGNLYPCCSPAIADTCLLLGNIKDKPLAELMRRGKYIDAYELIHDGDSFAELMSISESKGILTAEEKNLTSCEICRLMFRDEKNFEMLSADIERLHDKLIMDSLFHRQKSAQKICNG